MSSRQLIDTTDRLHDVSVLHVLCFRQHVEGAGAFSVMHFSHPVVNFNALVLEAYLLKICRAMPCAISSFFALIKCAHAIFQISDRSQTLYRTVCITSWTECNIIQLYSSMLIKYTAAIQKLFLLF